MRKTKGGGNGPPGKHLSIRAAAEIAGIPVSTMKNYLLRGLLPRIKIGPRGGRGRVLVSENDLAAFLEKHREDGSNEPRGP